jgi:hypothetical protein
MIMKSQMKPLLSFFVGLIFCCNAANAKSGIFHLTNFKLGYCRTSPSNFKSSTSPELGWTPIIDAGPLAVRGEISLFFAKNSNDSNFLISDYEAYLLLPVFSTVLVVEGGGGLQNWSGQGGLSPVLSGSLMFRIGESVDRLYLTYSQVFVSNNSTHVFKTGLAFNL